MRSYLKSGALMAAAIIVSAAAQAQQFTVEGGKAKTLRLSGPAASISLGNQNIAEVGVIERDLLLISGKLFGTTNLLVFNTDGEVIYSGDIVVTTNTANLVTVNRGGSAYTYNCSPECRKTIQLGDNPAHFGGLIEQMEMQKELNE